MALFVFNRPGPTSRVFEAIRAKRPRRLLVVGDGPRDRVADDSALCGKTREIVSAVDWPCEVEYLFSDVNLGCGRRVSSGLDWVFDQVPEAIVLEDDCLPHPSFFSFAAAMLERYRDDERIGMIAGTNYFSDSARPESYFFTRYFAVWGWAGWRRGWDSYDFEMRNWPAVRARDGFDALICTPGVREYLYDAFDRVYAGEIDTWDIQWVYACLLRACLCVVPRVNLVTNIGVAGTHGPNDSTVSLSAHPLDSADLVHPQAMLPDRDYEVRLDETYLRPPEPPAPWRRARGVVSAGILRFIRALDRQGR